MVDHSSTPRLSVICPTLNEASRLPLLIADLNLFPDNFEILVVDGGSSDLTVFAAKVCGAKIFLTPHPNRGKQLNHGALQAKGEWLLFLHADSRLTKDWAKVLLRIIYDKSNSDKVWFFDFKINKRSIQFWLLEISVLIRSTLLQRPYGDQGLLLTKKIYNEFGGYKDLHIMEDLDFIIKLTKKLTAKRIGIPLYTDSRKWKNINIFYQAIKNAMYRYKWRKGYDTRLLSEDYYRTE